MTDGILSTYVVSTTKMVLHYKQLAPTMTGNKKLLIVVAY